MAELSNHPRTEQLATRPVEPELVSIHDAGKIIGGVGRSKLYELIGAGEVEARKAGTRTVIVLASLRRYANSLPRAEISPPRARKRKGT